MALSHSWKNKTTLDGGLSLPDDEDSFSKLNLLWSLRLPTPNGEEIKAQAILEVCSTLHFRSLTILSLILEVELAGAICSCGGLGPQGISRIPRRRGVDEGFLKTDNEPPLSSLSFDGRFKFYKIL